ncbi:hypothetical protein KJ780_01325, partial [Candidatus Micrarchaeota archaeon]|nr:hypothetical protein [Candidatus Micrarchaeota archaeon]
MGSENIFSGLSIPELHLLIAQSPNPETSEAASLELIELMKNNGDIFALIKIAEDARRSENIREAAKAVLIPTGELAIKNFTEKGNLARLLKLKSHKNAPIEIRKAADIALFPAGLIAIGKHQLAKDEENLSKIMNDERLPDGVRKAAFTAIENIE